MKTEQISEKGFLLCQRKPDWVVKEVIRLKAHLPKASFRTITHTFNRIHKSKPLNRLRRGKTDELKDYLEYLNSTTMD